MLLMPSIDLRGGHCVRLLRGDFNAETRYDIDPVDLATRYADLGAQWLHVVDLDGARDGHLANRRAIASLAGLRRLRLQVGGGIRKRAVADELLALGVSRLAVGSLAVEKPAEVKQWFKQLGPEAICLALDVRVEADGVPRLRTRGWREGTQLSLWDAVDDYSAAGLRHVLCTDIARDGALSGPNVALYAEARRRFPKVRWQASGGVSAPTDLDPLRATGVSAAISGKALLEGKFSDDELRTCWRAA
jgi:phosphoribosylformimino-5-aminoimidazole carboxamide ribotide isomerase